MGKVQRTHTNRPEVKGLSVRQTAERLGVGITTVFALIRDGELRSLKIRSRRIVTAEAIDEFIAQRSEDRLGSSPPRE
jgi:excisionase family DNA binding protein